MCMRSFSNRIPLLSIILLLVHPYSWAYNSNPSLRSNLPHARSLVRPSASKISNDILSWHRHQEDILNRQKAIAYDDIESSERRRIKLVTDPIRNSLSLLWSLAKSSLKGASLAIRQSWWCLPMALALFPVYCLLIGTYAQMPSCWALKTFDHIRELYQKKQSTRSDSRKISFAIIAEILCFVDHGCALTSIFCFCKMCGLPSRTTMLFAIPSLVFLLFPGDKYLLIHSLWHFTSASTSVSWARDGVQKRKRFIAESLNSKRQGL